MLLRDEIENLRLVRMEDGSPPSDDCFDITSYNLRLGKEYCLIIEENQNSVGDCSVGTGVLRIPPFACALVGSEEIVCLPADIAGRWGLKIRPSMSGLVFQAGPQIQPGSHSRLFGLLFNLSSGERTLHYQDKLWSLDFVRLPRPVSPVPTVAKPALRMAEYTQNGLPSGSISEIYAEFRKLQRETSTARSNIGLAVVLAAITLIVSIGVPLVVTQIVASTSETIRQQQELKDRVNDLEGRLNRLSTPGVSVPSTTSP